MITEFGMYLKKLQSDNNESLRAMATHLGISAPFLSLMMAGKKTIPTFYANKIKDTYHLDENEYEKLFDSILRSNQRVDIEIEELNESQKDITCLFARKIKDADDDVINKIKEVLEKKG